MPTHLHVGGLVAAGFDPTGHFLLVVSHTGRGLFATHDWQRVARNDVPAYPVDGYAVGIGPIEGILVPVTETNYGTGELRLAAPGGKVRLYYVDGVITISAAND